MRAEARLPAFTARCFLHFLIITAIVSACVTKKNEWQDLDYSSVYRYYQKREIDSGYTPPSMGCMDEDLYNCK